MQPLTQLVLDYEETFIGIKLTEFTRRMNIPLAELNQFKTNQLDLSAYLIGIAAERNAKGLGKELTYGVLDDLMEELGQRNEGVPKGASPELTAVLREKVSRRVEFYQDLLATKGQFDDWQSLLRAKYNDIIGYREAVDKLTVSERAILPYENELLTLSNAPQEAIVKRPFTQSVFAAAYARRQIAEMVLKKSQ